MVNQATARAVRIRHYQGQRLIARDLQDDHDNPTWLRGLHVVALHDTWGIALGFDPKLAPTGDVVVGPGLAYDARGREIALGRQTPLPGPLRLFPPDPRQVAYELVISYDAGLGRREATRDRAPCGPAGDRPRAERPVFAWRRAGTTRLGLEVPLAAVRVAGGKLTDQEPDLTVRRYAQPQARPHIAAGSTSPEQPWFPWLDDTGRRIIGSQTFVDTSAAGFVGTPFYLASLRLPGDTLPNLLSTLRQPPRIMAFASVANPRPAGFTFRIVFAHGEDHPNLPVLPWQIAWLGVEPVAGCAPHPDFTALIALILDRTQIPLIGRLEQDRLLFDAM